LDDLPIAVTSAFFAMLPRLGPAIEEHIAVHNSAPKPFVWTDTASDILEKVKRGRAKLHNMQSA
jgi:hypothetical protein